MSANVDGHDRERTFYLIIKNIIFAGRDVNKHTEGISILMTSRVERALANWKPVNERIITAGFLTT